jgi:hypothetical protein
MSDVRCPSCGDVFRVPDFALPEGAVAGCPCCRARFSVSDLRMALPPLAELLDAEGVPLGVQLLTHAAAELTPANREQVAFAPPLREVADLQSGLTGDGPVPAAMVSDDRLPDSVPSLTERQAGSRWESNDARSEADDLRDGGFTAADEPLDLGFGIAQEPRPLEQVTAFEFADEPSAIPRPRGRRPGSPLRSLISVVLGGLLALPLAGILLALIGKPLDLGFWPFLGKQHALPIAIRAGEAAPLDDRPRTSSDITQRGGRSLGEDMGLLFQPNSEAEQRSASDLPAANWAAGTEQSQAPNGLPGEQTPPSAPSKSTSPTKASSGPSAAMPRGLALPVEADTAVPRQAATRAAEIAAMPPESNLFHDEHQVLIAEPESDAPLAATAQPSNRTESTKAAANATPEPVTAATQAPAVAGPAKPLGGTGSDQPTLAAPPTGLARDMKEASGNRVQAAAKPSEATTVEPRPDTAPRVAAAPDRSPSPRESDIAPPLTPRTTPTPTDRAPTAQTPAAVSEKSPEPLTLPKLPATRAEPKAATITSPPAALKQQPRPLSQAMRTELASMETAIQTLVNHRESDGTNVLKRRWADLYLAMARAGAIAEPQDRAELASLIRRMSDSDLIGPLSMMAANWMRISNRPSDGVLVVGPVEKKDGKTFIRWRGMVPLELRGLDPAMESTTDPVLILGRILSSDTAAPVVEVTFAETQAR